MTINEKFKILIIHVLLYLLFFSLFFLTKNLIESGDIYLSSYDKSSIFVLFVIVEIIDVFALILNFNYYKSFVIYILLLSIFFIVLEFLGINIEVLSVFIVYFISSFVWAITYVIIQ